MFRRFNNSEYTQISLYVIVVSFLIIAFYAFVDNVPYFFEMLVGRVKWIIGASKPLIIAIIVAYLLDPIVDAFEKLYLKVKYFKKKNICRMLASMTVAFIFIGIVSIAISIFIFAITDNFKFGNLVDLFKLVEDYKDSVNDIYNSALAWLNTIDIASLEIQDSIQDVAKVVLDYFKTWSISFAYSIGNFASFFTTTIIAIVMTIYLMIDGKMIMGTCDKVCKALFSDKIYRKMHYFIEEADNVFSGYIRGQCTDATVMMVLIIITLAILNFDYAVLIGIIAGIGNLIPYVGPIIAYGGVVVVTIFSGEWSKCFIAIICLFIIQTVDGNIIGPKLLSNSIKIHPLLVIICIVFGSAIGGLLGMLIAVPVGALIKVLFMNYIDKKLDAKEAKKEVESTVEVPKDVEKATVS